MIDLADNTIIVALIGASVVLLGTIITATFSFLNYLFNRKAKRSDVENSVGGIYDKLIDYRLEHPEVLSLSREWKPEFFKKIYTQKKPKDVNWVVYYGYVELCLGYCNSVLYMRKEKLLSKKVYTLQHEPLVKYLITEHYPIIYGLVKEEKFLSPTLGEYISERAKTWNWEKEYGRIPDDTPI